MQTINLCEPSRIEKQEGRISAWVDCRNTSENYRVTGYGLRVTGYGSPSDCQFETFSANENAPSGGIAAVVTDARIGTGAGATSIVRVSLFVTRVNCYTHKLCLEKI